MSDQVWSLHESPLGAQDYKAPVYESPGYDEALSRLLFIIEQQRHCGILFGPAGAGKSLMLGQLVQIVKRGGREVAAVDLHGRGAAEVLWELCGELGLSPRYGDSAFILWRRVLDHFLSNRGIAFPTVLVLDHVDQGGEESAGLVDRLIHLASQGNGLTLILALRGQHLSELPETFRDATDIRVELTWLDREQCGAFVRHVFQSPSDDLPVFEERAIDRLYSISEGSPRLLSHLCDLALLAAMAAEESSVTERLVLSAAADLQITGMPVARPAPTMSPVWPVADY